MAIYFVKLIDNAGGILAGDRFEAADAEQARRVGVAVLAEEPGPEIPAAIAERIRAKLAAGYRVVARKVG